MSGATKRRLVGFSLIAAGRVCISFLRVDHSHGPAV
jgi:hypothetical protein